MINLPEQAHTIEPISNQILPYTRLPDFPSVAELDVNREEYTYCGSQQGRLLSAGDKTQVGMGDVKECSPILVTSTDGQAVLAQHFSPDDPTFDRKLAEFLDAHEATQAVVLHGNRANYSSGDAAGLLGSKGLRVIDIPVQTGDRYMDVFFDLKKGELSVIGTDLLPDSGNPGALQRVVYRPFMTAGSEAA